MVSMHCNLVDSQLTRQLYLNYSRHRLTPPALYPRKGGSAPIPSSREKTTPTVSGPMTPAKNPCDSIFKGSQGQTTGAIGLAGHPLNILSGPTKQPKYQALASIGCYGYPPDPLMRKSAGVFTGSSAGPATWEAQNGCCGRDGFVSVRSGDKLFPLFSGSFSPYMLASESISESKSKSRTTTALLESTLHCWRLSNSAFGFSQMRLLMSTSVAPIVSMS